MFHKNAEYITVRQDKAAFIVERRPQRRNGNRGKAFVVEL